MTSKKRHQTGFALVAVVLITLMVMLTAVLALIPSLASRSASIRSGSAMRAGNVADAGLDFGLAALNSTVPTGASITSTALPAYFVQGTGGNATTWTYSDGANNNFFRTAYDRIVPVVTIRLPASVPVPGGAGTAADYRIIRAEATVRGVLRRQEVIAAIRRTTVRDIVSPFTRAITARGDIDANGNISTLRTNSYDSVFGAYGGANMGTQGGIYTDGSILGGGVYDGNVSAVGTIDPGVSVQGAGNVIIPHDTAITIPDPPGAPAATTTASTASLPATITPLAGEVVNLGAVSLSGNAGSVLTLNPGNYLMSSLSIASQASILCSGSGLIQIWVSGAINVGGNGVVNASQLPTNLKVMETNPTAPVSMAGNGNFYGVLQAPANTVTLGGNGAFFGAVVANAFTYNGSNSVVHYDAAVGRAFTTTSSPIRPSLWRTIAVHGIDRNG